MKVTVPHEDVWNVRYVGKKMIEPTSFLQMVVA